MAIATQAATAQKALDLGASKLNRRLHFWSIKSGRYLIDIFAGHVFEIRLIDVSGRDAWMAEIRLQNTTINVARRACVTREQAENFCETYAARLGGVS
jgi:hypothetical protein